MHCFRSTVEEDLYHKNIRVESWFTPKTPEEVDYNRYVGQLQKKIRQMTYNTKDLIGCDTDYIINLDMRPSGIRHGKSSYMSCEIMLFHQDPEYTSDEDTYLSLLEDLLQNDRYLKFYETKKDVAC